VTQLSLRSPVRLDSQKNLKRSDFRHRVARIVFKPDRRKHILAWLIIGACRVVKDRSWKSKSTATGQIPLVGLFAFAMHSVEYPSSLSRVAESVNGQEWIFWGKDPRSLAAGPTMAAGTVPEYIGYHGRAGNRMSSRTGHS